MNSKKLSRAGQEAEDDAVRAVFLSEEEIRQGKGLQGDLRELAKNLLPEN